MPFTYRNKRVKQKVDEHIPSSSLDQLERELQKPEVPKAKFTPKNECNSGVRNPNSLVSLQKSDKGERNLFDKITESTSNIKKSDSSLNLIGLQKYEGGEISVGLSFGTLKFTLT